MTRKHRGKVLFLATVYSHLAAFHIPFMQLLQEKGYEVHAAASSDGGRKEEIALLGVKCWEIPFSRSPYSLNNFKTFKMLKGLLKIIHFDLIHVHTPVASFLGRYLAKITQQGPVIYTAHGFHFYKGAPWRNWLLYYTAEKMAAAWTSGLITMNEEDFQNGKMLGFIPGENLFYVHGVGVNLKIFSETKKAPISNNIRAALNIPQDGLVFTCVAEFSPNKNHGMLFDAWRMLHENGRDNIYLLLVGNGALKQNFRERVAKEDLPKVFFLGYRHDVPDILSESNVVTLVSKREGLPRCIMEAMACGKPIVATDIRGSRDLIRDGENGFLVPLNDSVKLSHSLEMLIEDPGLREKMGIAGEKAIQKYSLEHVLKEMKTIYDRYLPVQKI